MRRILQNNRGNTILLSTFMLVALFLISLVIYSISLVYTKYQATQVDLERAGSVSVDRNMKNSSIRDLGLEIPIGITEAAIEANLMNTGWAEEGAGTWVRRSGSEEICRLTELTVTGYTGWMSITAICSMPMPWLTDLLPSVQIPISVKAKVLYIDP